MFYKNELYKHENFRDVAILVQDVIPVDNGVELEIFWMNVHYNEIGTKDPFPAKPETDRIFIHMNKVPQWRYYDAAANKGRLKSELDSQKN